MEQWVSWLNSLVWGPLMLVLILGTGILLMIRLKAMPLTHIRYGFRQLWAGRAKTEEGDIPPFSALMTSLAATVGTGNIAGVATAIGIGGPGALFWMWCSALVGMATKYAEAVCAVHYREIDSAGRHVGGPMYYIKNGLGQRWVWLGIIFAICGTVAGFGIGNTVQANTVADALENTFAIDRHWSALGMMLLVGLVLIGGIRSIASVATKLVPLMAFSYLVFGLATLLLNIAEIPAAISLVIKSAFTHTAAEGGFAGASVALALQYGVARGVFSNEAGLGSAPIAHAAAATNSPVRQGTIAMLGTFIDTLVICSITGLAIVVTGEWSSVEKGVAMSQAAFASALPFGDILVSVCLMIFAFTTILGWSYYGERCAQFLFGTKSVYPFRVLWVLAIWVGANAGLAQVWLVADTLNGLMAIPNLIALLALSGVVVKLTKEYFNAERN